MTKVILLPITGHCNWPKDQNLSWKYGVLQFRSAYTRAATAIYDCYN